MDDLGDQVAGQRLFRRRRPAGGVRGLRHLARVELGRRGLGVAQRLAGQAHEAARADDLGRFAFNEIAEGAYVVEGPRTKKRNTVDVTVTAAGDPAPVTLTIGGGIGYALAKR